MYNILNYSKHFLIYAFFSLIIAFALTTLLPSYVCAESDLVFIESEPNTSLSQANIVSSNYTGQTIKILGTINDVYYDVDTFRLDVKQAGKLIIMGVWTGDYFGLGLESDIAMSLRDVKGDAIATCKLVGSGLNMHRLLTADVTTETYYISVIQTLDTDTHVEREYSIKIEFDSLEPLGDINGDGKIDIIDITLVMRHVLNISNLSNAQRGLADVNQDGLIDILDVTLLLQKSLGLIDNLVPVPDPSPTPVPSPEPSPEPDPDPIQSPNPLPAQPLHLVAQDGTYLGKLTTNKYDTNGIYNEYGTYGSKYSSLSIWNEYGVYGSNYSSQSAFNDYTSTPPYIVNTATGVIEGRLTTNRYVYGAISPYILYPLLLELGL